MPNISFSSCFCIPFLTAPWKQREGRETEPQHGPANTGSVSSAQAGTGRPVTPSSQRSTASHPLVRKAKPQDQGKTDAGNRPPVAESSSPQSAADNPVEMHKRAAEVRAELLAGKTTGNYEKFGHVIRDDADGTPLAVQLKPERMEDFRCLLSLAKENLGSKKGAPVLLRSSDGYKDVDLFISPDGMAGVGKTRENMIVSFFKAPPASPKEARHHRAPDLMNVVIDRGGDCLVCLSHMGAYFNETYGFEILALVPRSPLGAYPGWTEQHNEGYKEEMSKFKVVTGEGENQRTVDLPYVVMRLNPALHETIRKDGKLSQPSQDFSNLNICKQVPNVDAGYEEVVKMREQDRQGIADSLHRDFRAHLP